MCEKQKTVGVKDVCPKYPENHCCNLSSFGLSCTKTALYPEADAIFDAYYQKFSNGKDDPKHCKIEGISELSTDRKLAVFDLDRHGAKMFTPSKVTLRTVTI